MNYSIRLAFLLIVITLTKSLSAQNHLEITQFSDKPIGYDLFNDWLLFDFKNIPHTIYSLVEDSGKNVVKATSNKSASGLIRKVDIDPVEYPIIEWRWKVTKLAANADVTKRSGDDYAARIYITFDLSIDSLGTGQRIIYSAADRFYPQVKIPIRAMNYIWANKAEVNSIHSNPWTNLSQMVVIQSGEENIGTWITEKRNILEDYRAIFKSDPPRINAIAIMTDSDNTKSSSEAFYDEIIFHKFDN